MNERLEGFKSVIARLAPLDEIPIRRRGKASELLVEYQLLKYVKNVIKVPKGVAVGDRIAVIELENGTIKYVPIEIKSVTIKNLFGIDVSFKFLSRFHGIYIIIVQCEKPLAEYDFLVLTDKEMKEEIRKKAKPKKWDKTHKEKRWRLKISRNLKGFKEYIDRWDKIINY